MSTQAPGGTRDVLPAESYRWQYVEERMRQAAAEAGFREVRTPVLEHAELFLQRATKDNGQKELCVFKDEEERSMILRPEGTAGAVRCFVEAGMYCDPLPCKLYYLAAPVFRCGNSNPGGMQETHQFGLECFGAKDATAEAELILLAHRLISGLGIGKLSVRIHAVGCPACRQGKHAVDGEGPEMPAALCGECSRHLTQLQQYLTAADVPYEVGDRTVRSRDFCTRLVFELVAATREGSLTVCSGGRYDDLIEELGGPKTPAAGLQMDMECVMTLLEHEGIRFPEPRQFDVFVTYMGDHAVDAFLLVQRLRASGLKADLDHCARSHKAQFKFAQKTGAPLCITLGDAEVKEGIVKIKNMKTRDEHTAKIDFADKACRSILKK